MTRSAGSDVGDDVERERKNTGMSGRSGGIYRLAGKRMVDLVATVTALIALFPVVCAVAVLARVRMGPPVLFRQMRPGLHGKPFQLRKFRTMTDERDGEGNLLPDSVRLTAFGRFLRKTSLDELPELWNVLKGDMSLVGPRPLLMQYLDRYTPEQARRHEVKPGITGWAQVNGRNNRKFSERLKMDVWYVDNVSLLLDLKIIVLTLYTVVNRAGVRTDFEACLTEVDDCGFSDETKTNGKDSTTVRCR